MKMHPLIKVYGDIDYRNPECPPESSEQITFFNWLRKQHPELGVIALHPRNEGKRSHNQAQRHKAEGMTTGASDIIIPASPSFVCELKRQDHTKSRWQKGQKEYLTTAQEHGAFVCVALGADAAKQALADWLKLINLQPPTFV